MHMACLSSTRGKSSGPRGSGPIVRVGKNPLDEYQSPTLSFQLHDRVFAGAELLAARGRLQHANRSQLKRSKEIPHGGSWGGGADRISTRPSPSQPHRRTTAPARQFCNTKISGDSPLSSHVGMCYPSRSAPPPHHHPSTPCRPVPEILHNGFLTAHLISQH